MNPIQKIYLYFSYYIDFPYYVSKIKKQKLNLFETQFCKRFFKK